MGKDSHKCVPLTIPLMDAGHIHTIVPIGWSSCPRESGLSSKETGACRSTTDQGMELEKGEK